MNGDPIEIAKRYDEQCADEVVFLVSQQLMKIVILSKI